MTFSNNINVLVAEGDNASRKAMADLLRSLGYTVAEAIDGGSAMKVADERNIDIAIFSHRMTPKTGFDFAKYVMSKDLEIGMIMIADDSSTDLLQEAGKHNIKQLMRKPVDLGRLPETMRRVLRAYGKNPDVAGKLAEVKYSPENLMARALALAEQNARSNMGGPFGAVVADAEGRLLGEGVNSVRALCDPTAHAEVLAIRRATEKLNKTDLADCIVYSSCEPTMLGQALIIATGIKKVYYGLSHTEVAAARINEAGILGEIAKPLSQRSVPYEQLQHDEALAIYKASQAQRKV